MHSNFCFSVKSSVAVHVHFYVWGFRLSLGFLVFLSLALRRLVASVVALSFRLRTWHRRRSLRMEPWNMTMVSQRLRSVAFA